MKKQFDLISRLAPWVAFICSLAAYWLTVEPGASLWDCPEYITGAMRLEIGHPPGNPTWLLFHRIVSLLGITPAGAVLAVNLASGLFTAWAVGLLCACTQKVLRTLLIGKLSENGISICALAGSLCFGWADSPWFSAVEAEVYAMSLWMTALCIWLMLKWLDLRLQFAGNRKETGLSSQQADYSIGKSRQILILISYIIGLSIGVHQLTMLIIPGLAMIFCYGLIGPKKRAHGRQWLAAVTGALLVCLVLIGLLKGVPRLLAWFELRAVNDFGWNYNAGILTGWIGLLSLICILAAVTARCHRALVSEGLWCLFFVCLGFTTYAIIPLRASANPPMNQGNPSDIFSLITYLDRDQYGGAPLLYGSTPNSRPLKREHIRVTDSGDTVRTYYDQYRIPQRGIYSRKMTGARIPNSLKLISGEEMSLNDSLASSSGDAYLLTGYRYRKAMVPELEMWFPRLHSSNPADVAAYEDWTGMNPETMVRVRITEAVDSLGRPVPMRDAEGNPLKSTELRPTYMQNLAMLSGYQSGYMYFRYFLWNFSGRQNDVHSTGEVEHGNFITGITPIDNLMLGAEDRLPDSVGSRNPGRNRYFMIPLLLGLTGLIWLWFARRRGRRVAGVSAVLFLMTGLAIVLYLNQTPGEPRERDYSFLGSFWVFAFWISSGMAAVSLVLKRFVAFIRGFFTTLRDRRVAPGLEGSFNVRHYRINPVLSILLYVLFLSVPLLMLAENFDDHDRSGRYPADEYAGIVLESLPENTILFTTGDNHTFPLWYARNARGVRRDVTVINTSYLQLPWQVLQLMSPDENGRKVNMTMKPKDIVYGGVALVRVSRDTTTMDAVEALKRLYADTAAVPVLPSSRLRIGGGRPVIFDVCEHYGIAPGGVMNLRQLAMLDIIATNAVSEDFRPIALHRILISRGMYGWGPYLSPTTFASLWEPDTLGRYTSDSRRRIQRTRPSGRPGGRYIDPVYGDLISYQRMSLMTEARRALEKGDTLDAVNLLKLIADRYPFNEWSPILKAYCGEVINEAVLFADLTDQTGICSETADSLRVVSGIERSQWRRYRKSLPAHLQKAITPIDRRLAADP